MFIDTHCHLSMNDCNDVIAASADAGVNKIIFSACEVSSFNESIDILKSNSNLYLTIGFHPSEAGKIDELSFSGLEKILKSNSRIVGVGEIGLDYHHDITDDLKLVQKRLFEEQLKIAEKFNLPVVIHSRDATFDTISILKNYNVKGVIHCFSGSVETALNYIRMGYKIGIGGVVTFKNSNLPSVVSHIGIDNIVLETDSPYLAPEPLRGSINTPANIPIIAKKVADILNLDISLVKDITYRNATNLFDLP